MRKKIDIAEKLERLSKEGGATLPEFSPKKATDIVERVPVKVSPSGRPYTHSIKDLVVPESSFDLFTIEVTTDPSEKERITQLLGLREDPKVKVMWTALKDASSKEFEALKTEKLRLIKSYLPMYGREFPDGSLLISHQGDYTFSMASHEMKIERMIRHFEYALELAKKYELKV